MRTLDFKILLHSFQLSFRELDTAQANEVSSQQKQNTTKVDAQNTQCLCISLGLLCHEDMGLQGSVTKIPYKISNPIMVFYQDSSGGYAGL